MNKFITILLIVFSSALTANENSIVLREGKISFSQVSVKPETFSKDTPLLLAFGWESSEAPKTELKYLQVVIRGKNYTLDSSRMYNAIHSDGKKQFGISCMESNPQYCIIRGKFGDGAGAYAAEWHVYEGQSFRTVLTNELDVRGEISNHLNAYKW